LAWRCCHARRAVTRKSPTRSESERLAYCRLEEPARKSIALGVISKQGQRRDVTLPLVIELVPE
jgi:hypothetical protein